MHEPHVEVAVAYETQKKGTNFISTIYLHEGSAGGKMKFRLVYRGAWEVSRQRSSELLLNANSPAFCKSSGATKGVNTSFLSKA